MEPYKIIMKQDAENDLIDLFNYIAKYDLAGKANIFVEEILGQILKLNDQPHRGHCICKIKQPTVHKLYEIFYKSQRILYQVTNNSVIIHGIIDSRRDLKKVLQRRFTGITMDFN